MTKKIQVKVSVERETLKAVLVKFDGQDEAVWMPKRACQVIDGVANLTPRGVKLMNEKIQDIADSRKEDLLIKASWESEKCLGFRIGTYCETTDIPVELMVFVPKFATTLTTAGAYKATAGAVSKYIDQAVSKLRAHVYIDSDALFLSAQ